MFDTVPSQTTITQYNLREFKLKQEKNKGNILIFMRKTFLMAEQMVFLISEREACRRLSSSRFLNVANRSEIKVYLHLCTTSEP